MPAFLVFIREKTLDHSELKAYWGTIRAVRPISRPMLSDGAISINLRL
jgi:hypothetical protein